MAVGTGGALVTANFAAAGEPAKRAFQPFEYAPSPTVYVPAGLPAGTDQSTTYERCSPTAKFSLWNHFWKAMVSPPGGYTTTPTRSPLLAVELVSVAVMRTDPPATTVPGSEDAASVKVGETATGVGS